MLYRSFYQPTQWTEVNVAHLSSTDLDTPTSDVIWGRFSKRLVRLITLTPGGIICTPLIKILNLSLLLYYYYYYNYYYYNHRRARVLITLLQKSIHVMDRQASSCDRSGLCVIDVTLRLAIKE